MVSQSFSTYFKNLDLKSQQAIVDELIAMLKTTTSNALSVVSMGSKNEIKPPCPYCQSIKVQSNGKYKGVQRYVCKSCKKYFRQTTGKVTFGLKKPELIGQYLHYMLMGFSIALCAEKMNISLQTSFDWRHKFLSSFVQAGPKSFEGVTESTNILFVQSAKGSKNLTRQARQRGGKMEIDDQKTVVIVTCDRSGNRQINAVFKNKITKQDLDNIFKDKLNGIEALCTGTNQSYSAFAKANGLKHKKLTESEKKDSIYHMKNANILVERLQEWMQSFNGVNTKYLQNYLNWFIALEKIKDKYHFN